jgi:hypothetical protein
VSDESVSGEILTKVSNEGRPLQRAMNMLRKEYGWLKVFPQERQITATGFQGATASHAMSTHQDLIPENACSPGSVSILLVRQRPDAPL